MCIRVIPCHSAKGVRTRRRKSVSKPHAVDPVDINRRYQNVAGYWRRRRRYGLAVYIQ